MIALDTSAIVAIACAEQEEEGFSLLIVKRRALVGTPTLVETRLALESKLTASAAYFLESFLSNPFVDVVPFTFAMYQEAAAAFERYGKGRGHPAQLNFGDCMAYAVAKTHDVPLLYKGRDFARTDIQAAL